MIALRPPFRWATPADAAAMAEFVNMAGEGLPLHLWKGMAEEGEDPWEVGRRRAGRESGSFSYRNAVMLEEGGRTIGCLIGYLLPEEPAPIDRDEMPAMFVGLQELENLAPGSWYVNVLAVATERRGSGHGNRLLSVAEEIAAKRRARGISIIVSDGNRGARALYERRGYRQAAERPMVKEGWRNSGANWVLLVKGL